MEELKAQPPVTIEKTVEKPIEVEKTLTGSQFICELEEQVSLNARKIRLFAKKDGFVTGDNYPNELANIAVKQFINRHYSDLVKK